MSKDISEFIKIYADKECTILLESKITWDAGFKLKLVTGEEVVLENTAMAGQIVNAVVYLKNETDHRYAITNIRLEDERIKTTIGSGWLIPNVPVKLTLTFQVPSTIVPKSVMKKGKIRIEGFYIRE